MTNDQLFYTVIENETKIYYTLRIAAAMCFIGHGAFGLIGKEIWCNYFAVFGIGHGMAYKLMPWVGSVDILCGISLLIYPTKAVLTWLVVWGTITALMRPMSGEPFAEFIERAGNFGAPLALLVLSVGKGAFFKGFPSFVKPVGQTDEATIERVTYILRAVVFLLLVGHGWLNLIEKKGLMGQYTALGFSNPGEVAHIAGMLELTAACLLLIRPLRPVIFALLIWKVGTELFYPHWEIFEWIERGGSYGSLLALWFVLPQSKMWAKNPQPAL
jgi:hypothetical protein